MENKPLVSIVIPVYNGANYLRCAIDSAIAQTYSNIEIIVVNDGSCDEGETEEIALSYGDRVRYFSKENGGTATALNLGIQQMQGEYFVWLSHDDMLYPDKIEGDLLALAESGDYKTIVWSSNDRLYQEKNKIEHVYIYKEYPITKLESALFPVIYNLMHSCTLLIHKGHFDRVGIFDENQRTTHDYCLWFLMFRGQKTIYRKKATVIQRVHEKQGSRTIDYHMQEVNMMKSRMASSIQNEDIRQMGYLEDYYFWIDYAEKLKMEGNSEALKIALESLDKAEEPSDILAPIISFHKDLRLLYRSEIKYICIFGAGFWGKRCLQELQNRLVNVTYISDNDATKWGTKVDGVVCISPDDLETYKESALVIAAKNAPEDIIKDLKERNFQYVVSYDELKGLIKKTSPVKWPICAYEANDVDYSSPQIKELIDYFKQSMCEIASTALLK